MLACLLAIALLGFLFFFSNNLSTVIVLFCICAVIILSSVKKPDLYWYFLIGLALVIIAAIGVTVYLLMHQGAENFRFVRMGQGSWTEPY